MRVLNEQYFYEICHEIWNTKGPGNMKFEWNLTEIWNMLAKFEISLWFYQVTDPSVQPVRWQLQCWGMLLHVSEAD